MIISTEYKPYSGNQFEPRLPKLVELLEYESYRTNKMISVVRCKMKAHYLVGAVKVGALHHSQINWKNLFSSVLSQSINSAEIK